MSYKNFFSKEMEIIVNPKLGIIKHEKLLGQGLFGKVYEISDTKVLKISTVANSDNILLI